MLTLLICSSRLLFALKTWPLAQSQHKENNHRNAVMCSYPQQPEGKKTQNKEKKHIKATKTRPRWPRQKSEYTDTLHNTLFFRHGVRRLKDGKWAELWIFLSFLSCSYSPKSLWNSFCFGPKVRCIWIRKCQKILAKHTKTLSKKSPPWILQQVWDTIWEVRTTSLTNTSWLLQTHLKMISLGFRLLSSRRQ